jgi:hypothetical protein
MMRRSGLMVVALAALALTARGDEGGITYRGEGNGPGRGKSVVLISGDEEYRSEEGLVQLARILAQHHGFDCTVLFAIDPKTGQIEPTVTDNIPGTEALDRADLLIIATRFRNLPESQMRPIVEYLKAGKPVIGLRTATHAFNIPAGKPFATFSHNSKEPGWEGGFGRLVLGETWINHHGSHGKESTRGLIAPGAESDPLVRGIAPGSIWGPTDVYTVRLPLPGDSQPIVLGQVLTGMKPDDPPLPGPKNDPMMPVAWTHTYTLPDGGQSGKAFATTMGSSVDLQSEGLRRLLVNATYALTGLEAQIPPKATVDIVGTYEPLPFGFGKSKKGLKPADVK